MRRSFKVITILIFCVLIVISSIQIIFSLLVRNTIMSERFYGKVTLSPNYIPMVSQSVSFEFDAQSRFTGIPLEYFTSALDSGIMSEMLKEHVKNATGFLKGKEDFEKKSYPAGLFLIEFENFIEELKEENDEFEADDSLYIQLAEVAEDSAGIVDKHINILRLDLVKDMPFFKRVHKMILLVSSLLLPAVLIFVTSIAGLFYFCGKNKNQTLFFTFNSLWITGTLLFIPSFVLNQTGVARRLAINSTYFKFAVDTWLGKINEYLLISGALIFFISIVVLSGRYFYKHIFSVNGKIRN